MIARNKFASMRRAINVNKLLVTWTWCWIRLGESSLLAKTPLTSIIPPPFSTVVTCYDPEKLNPNGQLDYLRENRTREREYDFDHVG